MNTTAVTQYLRRIIDEGYEVQRTKKNNYRVTHPDREGMVHISSTPRNALVLKTMDAKLRRLKPKGETVHHGSE